MLKKYFVLMFVLTFSALGQAGAEPISVEATIKSVKPEAKEITVGYKTRLGDKSITLDVSRKAKITLNGKPSELKSLRPGHKVIVEYRKDLEIVTGIIATGKNIPLPELVEVSELGRIFPYYLSEDGMTIYYQKSWNDAVIYSAHRKDAESLFEDAKVIFKGRQPVVTNDGLEMILIAKQTAHGNASLCFHSATRDSVNDSFRRPRAIRELRDLTTNNCPRNAFFSSDGLTLYFLRYRKDAELVFTKRLDRKSPWAKPQVLKLNGSKLFPPTISTLFVTEDNLTLLCVVETSPAWMLAKGNLLKFTRSSPKKSFGNPEFVEIKGLPKLVGRYPHYIPATKELFFLQSDEGLLGKSRLIIIKNFVL